MALSAGSRLGPYEIVAPLGAGGMGEVYRAKDPRLGREVAIKVVSEQVEGDPARQRRLMQEARAASALNHPNILAVYDVGLDNQTPYIVSELIDGEPLRKELQRGPLPIKRLLELAVQIADGLAAAHEAGIFHRDLKPDNILVNRSGRVKIIDFGLAKPLATPGDDPDAKPTMTESGLILGTVPYMSPEQARGAQADFRSDQFSFGLILYEMATGKPAFRRETPVQTLSAIISEEPEPVATLNPKVPAPLRWVIDRCLAKEPRQRYAATADLFHDLGTLRERLSEAITGDVVPVAPVGRRWRRDVFAGLALLAAAGSGLLLWLFPFERTTAPAFRQLTFGHGNITGARFAADGQSVIYGAAWVGNSPELYMTHPGSPEARSLGIPNSGIWSVSPSGEMAIAIGCTLNWSECIGTLAVVPSAGGAPREILENVHEADWAPDGKTLAVAQFSEGRDRLHYPVGQGAGSSAGKSRVLYEAAGWITDVRVSPNGDLIAFFDHPILGGLAGSVSVLDLAGKKRTLSSGWEGLQGLAWSPSGEEVWFTGSRVNVQSTGLHAASLSGRVREDILPPQGTVLVIGDISRDGQRILLWRGDPRAVMMGLTPGEAQERDLSWFDYSTVADLSADGQTVLFYEWGAAAVGRTPTVYLRRTDGAGAVRLGEGKPLALSPDGQWALALQQTFPPQLVLLPTGPGEQKPLARGAIREFFDWAAWAPDSARIFFAAEEPGRRRRTYVQDIQGGLPQPVTPEGLVGTSLSPDGRLLTAVGRYGGYYVYRVGTEEPEPLDGYEEGDTVLQWSSDGGSLFVRAADDMRLKLFKLDLKSGRREPWKELTPPHAVGLTGIATDPGQVRLTPNGTSYVYTYWTHPSELYLVEGLR